MSSAPPPSLESSLSPPAAVAEPAAAARAGNAHLFLPEEGIEGGPEKLVEILVGARMVEDSWFSHSESDLRTLVSLVYETSFKKDEGRYPRFSLLLPWNQKKTELPICSFASNTELTPQALHRLAAAAPTQPYALQVRAEHGKIWADGVVRVEHPGWILREGHGLECKTFSSGVIRSARIGGMLVRVNGPGEMEVSDFGSDIELRAGRIYSTNSEKARYWFSSNLVDCFREAEEQITQELNRYRPPRVEGGATFHHPTFVLETWGHILRLTVQLAHGGAYIVLPQQVSVSRYETPDALQFDFRVNDFSLADLVGQYAISHLSPDMPAREAALTRLIDGVKVLVQFSSVDGCVVVDSGLNIRAFGAKILARHSSPSCHIFDPIMRTTDRCLDLRTLGTRHGSAFGLVEKIPGSTVFVISQDGQLRIFHHRKSNGQIGVVDHLLVDETYFAGR